MLLCPRSTAHSNGYLSIPSTYAGSGHHGLGKPWSKLIMTGWLTAALCSCSLADDPMMQHPDADHRLHLIGKEIRQTSSAPPPWLVQLILPQPASQKNQGWTMLRRANPFLRNNNHNNPYSSVELCGGVIIGEQTILTARHCLFEHPSTHLLFDISQQFIHEYLRPTTNSEPLEIGLTDSLTKFHSIPKSFLTYQAHPQADLATITTNDCRLYDSSNFFSKVKNITLHSNKSNAHQHLIAYGNGGKYTRKDLPSKFRIHYSKGLHAIAPPYFPAMYDPQLDRPKPMPTLDIACDLINESKCLVDPIDCSAPHQTVSLADQEQCGRTIFSVGMRYFIANKYMLSHHHEPWPDIYKQFPNYQGYLSVFHPKSTHQVSADNTYFCSGDSGSPLVNKDGELVGIFSTIVIDSDSMITPAQDTTCSPLNLAVDVSHYAHWITATMPRQDSPKHHLPLCSQLWGINKVF